MDNWDWFKDARILPASHKFITCYAAFNHMRIKRNGNMSPCCFATHQIRWKKDEFSLKDYWFGKFNSEYQEAFLNSDLHHGCKKVCGYRISNKIDPPIYDYDWNVGDERLVHALDGSSWPKVFEFEISNLCNFACPMCMGELSSKHMLGRDKFLKEWDPNVFDNEENANKILHEFEEFIPHLEEIRFTGGEPFSHKLLYALCSRVAAINPKVSIMICTNGSVFNKKVEKICRDNNLRVSISVDTIIPEEYELIRVGGVYKETYNNIEKFINSIGTEKVTINTTLMSVNAFNIDKLFKYAYEKEVEIFINIYERNGRRHTEDWGVRMLSQKELLEIWGKLMNIKSEVLYEKPDSVGLQNMKSIHKCIRVIENEID